MKRRSCAGWPKLCLWALLLAAAGGKACEAQQPFTLQQILSAPYASELTAAPVGARFAWVENAEGVHNLWVGGPNKAARAITHYSADDGQDIGGLAWSTDGAAIAYTYGAESGASGRPANPAHLQRPTALHVIIQPLDDKLPPVDVSEGHAPLFTRDGKSLLFLRGGQIWVLSTTAGSDKQCWLPEGCASLPTTAAPAAGADAAKVHQLVFDRGSASSLTLSPDGKLLAYVSTRHGSDTSHSFIALYDFAAKTLRFVSPSAERDFAPAFSPDGKQLAWLRGPVNEAPEFVNERVSANPWSIQIADVASGETRTVFTPEANKPGSVLPHLATGEPRLFYASRNRIVFYGEMDGWVHLYSVDALATDARPSLLTPGKFEVNDASLRGGEHSIYYSSNSVGMDMGSSGLSGMVSYAGPSDAAASYYADRFADDDRQHVWRLDLDRPEETPTKLRDDQGIQTHPVVSADGTVLAVLASTTSVPMHPALIANDPPAGKMTEVRDSHGNPTWIVTQGGMTNLQAEQLPKEYPAGALVVPEQVLFDSVDGVHLHGQLFRSGREAGPSPAAQDDKTKRDAAARLPAIIFVHGGPRRQMLLGYPAMDYYSNAYAMNQYLASRGFIVLSVNYRCGIGYGLDFRQCEGEGAAGAKEYNDVLAAQKYLASRADVDAKRIGIWGGSYGGYLTALALARNSNLFAAGVDFHGVHEWALEDNAPTDWLRGTVIEREKIEALAHASSPMADIDRWRSPVLLIHGDDDPEVAYAQTPILAEALRARGVPVETLVFPDEVHGFLLHKDWVKAYEATAAFFERTLHPQTVK